MQWRTSPSLAVVASLFFLITSDLVVAQISAPSCTDVVSSWKWSFNSLGQNPCKITAYMMSTCYRGAFAVNPLGLGDTAYAGPSRQEVQEAGLCWCNTVAFSLISACSECQGGQSLFWSEYRQNCARTLEPSTFPNPVPAGTRVPQWALIDITFVNFWSASTAQLVGDTPEIFPGQRIDTPATFTIKSTSSPSPTFTTRSTSIPTPTFTISHTSSTSFPTVPEPTSPSFSSGIRLNMGANDSSVARGIITIAAIFLSLLLVFL
ncbi:hypothetical protein H4582DRAFT_1952141 [Lactarius indigo]|nr:hypothetical protein H4582DRAFT_1952141 [Lactarius indigo]